MANLILVRHGESEWNAKGLWTGLTDIPLSENGRLQAEGSAELLKDLQINLSYTSLLSRSKETLEIILQSLGLTNIQIIENKALNERDYGIYTGKNKWDIKKEVGDERFLTIRRSWDFVIPQGESLKDVYNRVVPYYQTEILPKLKSGKNVIIVAHGNSIRALVKYLENISNENIQNIEIGLGEIYIYKIDENGNTAGKEIRSNSHDVP
ncbi:MAG: 2,3-diphosphoglycerate-dependent phosphoglycerate mutase [Patescibacteria group bacterium]|nr:2,3-diphosphoglycerate-dependent phosphoglycerate mutase [Patescibacteria group bacterium]